MRLRYRGKAKSTYKGSKITKGTKGTGKSKQTLQVTEPSEKVTEEPREASISTPGSDGNGPGGRGGVLIALIILYMFVLWSGFFKPVLETAWDGKKLDIQMNGWVVLGGIVFIFIMNSIATINDTTNKLAWTFVVGLYAVYIIMNVQSVNKVSGVLTGKRDIGDATGKEKK